MSRTLTILIVSDPHDDVQAIHRVAEELQDRGIKPDVVLCPGDLTTMKSKLGVRPDDAVLKQYDDSSAEVLSALAGINPALFWIPGNHDPDTMFEDPESLTIAASTLNIGTNIHGKLVQLAPSLYLAGYGGAVEASIDGQPSWGAYPVTDEELGAGILPLSEEISILPADSSVLLMTHCGPNGSSTAEVSGWDANSITAQGVREHWVLSGSRSLRDMIQSEQLQSKTLLNVHGHTHNGCGMARLGAVTVLNPGSVRYTRSYAVLTLAQHKEGGKWHRGSIEIVEMPELL